MKVVCLLDSDCLSFYYFMQPEQNPKENHENLSQVQAFRILACKELHAATRLNELSNQESDSERIKRLLLRVSSLKRFDLSIMEELFFGDLIKMPIDTIIPSMIDSDKTS